MRRSIAVDWISASSNHCLVTKPRRREAIRAMRCSTVLDFPRIPGKSQESWRVRPLDVDVYDHRREQQRQVGERR